MKIDEAIEHANSYIKKMHIPVHSFGDVFSLAALFMIVNLERTISSPNLKKKSSSTPLKR